MSSETSMRLSTSTTRTYKDAINALNTLQSNFASIEAIKKLGPNVNKNQLSINEVYEYTRRLGYQPKDFNKLNLIHVTGTKGKGSTCAFTESILEQYRLKNGGGISKIGLFTSPHLKTVRERVRINGRPIDENKFAKYFFEVWDKLSTTESDAEKFPTLQPSDTVKPMYFKYLTILSFHVFMSEGVDTAIYEVGVGGTYDSTNIIDQPTVCGITSLGIDHTFMLGTTIESIAHNKTGIFKKGSPAYVSEQLEYPESLKVIEERAKELGVSKLEVVSALEIPKDIKLGLAGDFQKLNAVLAVQLAREHLTKLNILPPIEAGELFTLTPEFIKGLEVAKWEGRCQIIKDKPTFENITWYIDGAHTLESVNVASSWFRKELSSKTPTSTKRVLLFNQQSRENANALLAKLYENVVSDSFAFDHVIFTTNVTWSSGKYNSDLVSLNTSKEQVDKLIIQKELAEAWNGLDSSATKKSRKHIFADIETGVNFIKSLSEDKVEVFVCGSLHLVGGLLVVLDNETE